MTDDITAHLRLAPGPVDLTAIETDAAPGFAVAHVLIDHAVAPAGARVQPTLVEPGAHRRVAGPVAAHHLGVRVLEVRAPGEPADAKERHRDKARGLLGRVAKRRARLHVERRDLVARVDAHKARVGVAAVALHGTEAEELVAEIGPTLQRYLDGTT